MIISHKHKFIFLKTSKTAGTSIEIALSKFCGQDDIITPIAPEDEKTRKELGYPGPQNYLANLSEYSFYDYKILLIKGMLKRRFYNHIQARKARSLIEDEIWNRYYKFCVERNPWDRVISMYYWHYRSNPKESIKQFIESQKPVLLKQKGFELYTIDGQIAVDKICRFENLNQELEVIRQELSLPEELKLPRSKSKYRKDKRNYRDILDSDDRSKIAKLFEDEISLMGYEF